MKIIQIGVKNKRLPVDGKKHVYLTAHAPKLVYLIDFGTSTSIMILLHVYFVHYSYSAFFVFNNEETRNKFIPTTITKSPNR